MKIDGIKRGITKSTVTKGSAKSRGSAKASATKGDGLAKFADNDSVEVSNHAATLDLIRELVDASPDVRVESVEKIVSQIRGGKYKINFEKVAEGFIKEAVMNEMVRRDLRKKGKDGV